MQALKGSVSSHENLTRVVDPDRRVDVPTGRKKVVEIMQRRVKDESNEILIARISVRSSHHDPETVDAAGVAIGAAERAEVLDRQR